MKQFFKEHLFLIRVFLVWVTFMIIVLYFVGDFTYSSNMKIEKIGQLGDTFNILTSLFTGLAFAGLLISISLQKEELGEVKKEFKEQTKALESQQKEMVIQSFDNKFFQMLNLFNNIIDGLSYKRRNTSYATARTHIDYTQYGGINAPLPIPEEFHKYEKREVLIRIKNIFEKQLLENQNNFQLSFDYLNREHDTTFKFYFINLYQILKYVDKQFDNDIESAKNYTNIVRAQLSKDELVLLFYNAIGVIPFSGKNYKILVEKYAFFEHLTYQDLNRNNNIDTIDILLKKYKIEAFGKNEELKRKVLTLQSIQL